MSEQWYYAQNGQHIGPVTIASLRSMSESGGLRPEDLVWQEGLPNWIEARSVPEIYPVGTVTPLNYQRPAFAHEFVYAGFWLRFVAAILDGIITGVAGFIIGFILGYLVGIAMPSNPTGAAEIASIIGNIVGIVVGWLYFAMMESSPWQATLGKRALNLRVTTTEGAQLTFARATGRHFAKYISMLTLFIGYMMAGWTERKQALHDIMAGTIVTRR